MRASKRPPRIQVPAEESRSLLHDLEKRFSLADGFGVVALPVQASIPRSEAEEEKAELHRRSNPA
jgi:hypothetical protein